MDGLNCVTLGKGAAYIIIWNEGHVVWDLKRLYDSLDERLIKILATTTKLTYAALNAYAKENYFCLFDGSSCAFQFPETDDSRRWRNWSKIEIP
jgi:hypothetical protein